MNALAPRTAEVTLDTLGNFGDAARITLESTSDGGIRLLAPKGFISRQLDSLRALFCRSQIAHEDYKTTLGQIKQMISTAFGEDTAIAFEHKFSSKTNEATPPPPLKVADIRMMFTVANNTKQLEDFKKDVLEPFKNTNPEKAEATETYFNKQLNEFLSINPSPSPEKFSRFLKDVESQFSAEALSEEKLTASAGPENKVLLDDFKADVLLPFQQEHPEKLETTTSHFNIHLRNFLEKTSSSLPKQTSDDLRNHTVTTFRAMKEAAKTPLFTNWALNNVATKAHEEVKGYLAKNPTASQNNAPVSADQLSAFLEDYKKQYLQPSTSQSTEKAKHDSVQTDQPAALPSNISNDEQKVLASLRANPQALRGEAIETTNAVLNNRDLSGKTANVGHDLNKFFPMLEELSASDLSNNNKPIPLEEKEILLDNLLKNFTIFENENRDAYKLVKHFGSNLATLKKSGMPQNQRNINKLKKIFQLLQKEARVILATDDTSKQQVKAVSSSFKKYAEKYTAYREKTLAENKIRAASGKPLLAIRPMKHAPEKDVLDKKEGKNALLSRDARDLITAIDDECQNFLDQLEPPVSQSTVVSSVQSPLQNSTVDPTQLA